MTEPAPFMLVKADVRRGLPFADGTFQCVVTSPPYFGLRDYGTDGQLGLEKTPDEYVRKMVAVFREVRRVLRDDGTFWLNIGDSFCNAGSRNNGGGLDGKRRGGVSNTDGTWADAKASHGDIRHALRGHGIKHKDLLGIPWLLAFALRADGWYLRQEVIWDKPNPMPESVTDRPSRSHEQVFLLTKKPRYFYDDEAVREPDTGGHSSGNAFSGRQGMNKGCPISGGKGSSGEWVPGSGRNIRSVWRLSVGGYKGAHFATMPKRLAARCILAGTSEHGCCPSCGKPWNRITERTRTATRPGKNSKVIDPAKNGLGHRIHHPEVVGNRDPQRHTTIVCTIGWEQGCGCPSAEPVPCRVFDPFGGAGTTPKVATILGRHGFATEISADYLALARERMDKPERIGPKPPGTPKVIVPSSGQLSFF